MTVIINATKARQNFFDLLVATRDKKQITKVKLNGVVVAKLVPEEEKKFDWDKYRLEVEEAVKYLSKFDWSDVLEVRKKSKARRYKGW
jgi:PHD/YefM family antitoxin component YafN of YafNO toxin-antitoxin module